MTTSEGSTSQPATPQTTTSEPISFDVDLGTALIELDRKECLELLAAKSVGRIAYTADYGARILPVNYVLADDSIIFRTVPNGEIFHHALNSMCAFEIDDTKCLWRKTKFAAAGEFDQPRKFSREMIGYADDFYFLVD